jgi:hypothetical protein
MAGGFQFGNDCALSVDMRLALADMAGRHAQLAFA